MQTVGVNEFQGLNVPLITIERFLENGTGAVECDNIQGGRLAAEHLIAQGCRHLIHISGVHETAMPADERAAGFREVCEQKNVQYQVVGTHAYEYNHLEYHEVLEQLLLQHPDTDGIFASSDLIAAQLLSFDPNIREPLWQSMEEAKRQTAYGMEVCDVLKISDNEIRWFTGEEDFDRGVDKLWREYHIPLILLSMGSGGSRAYCGSRRAEQPAFLQEGTIETTGAGDTFGAHFVPEKAFERRRFRYPSADIPSASWQRCSPGGLYPG